MRYVLKVSYDGTSYHGWQVQNNGVSVQEEMEKAIFSVFGENVRMVASGRTDSGVHALGQVCHFDSERIIPDKSVAAALNSHLPCDISVTDAKTADVSFDSNRSAKKKTYVYRFYCSAQRIALLDRYAYHISRKIDLERLKEAANLYAGEHNFKAYCASRSCAKTYDRYIYSCDFTHISHGLYDELDFEVCGSGFLYNMVRTMAGTALDYMNGRMTKDDIISSLASGDRQKVGRTLPPNGLFLKDVDYGDADPFKK